MGSFTNINTYAQQTVEFTDDREPGPRIFPPVPVNQTFAFDRPLTQPFPIPMGTQIEQIIRPGDALLNLWINVNDAPGATVTWENLPTGVALADVGGGYYIVGPINTVANWNQIATGGKIQFAQEGTALYRVSLQWFDSDEYKTVEWINATFIPVALIRGQFTAVTDPSVIFAPRYDFNSEFVFYNLSGKLFRITRNLQMTASLTAVRNRIRGFSFARSAVFTMPLAIIGARKQFNSVQLSNVSTNIIPLRIKRSPVVANSTVQVTALGGFRKNTQAQLQTNSSIVCNGISTTIVNFAADVVATSTINIIGVSTRIREFAANFAPVTTQLGTIGIRLAGLRMNAVSVINSTSSAKRYASLAANPTIVASLTGNITPMRMELEWLATSALADRKATVQLFGPATVDWGNQIAYLDAGTWNLVAPAGSSTRTIIDSTQPFRFYQAGTGLSKVLSWPNAGFTTLKDMFKDANNLTEVYNYPIKVSGTTVDASYMFYNTKIATDLNLIMNFVGNRLSNTSYMFENTQFNKDIGSWDMSNVTDMRNMFKNVSNFNNGGSSSISNWNTGNVTNMSSTFYNTAINQSLSGWNTSNVTDMSWMFFSTNLFTVPAWNFSTWNTSNVTNMSNMFRSSTIHSSNGVQSWNTANVTDMSYMFASTSLFSASLNSWNTSNVTNMSYMFDQSYFNGDIDAWDTSSVTNMSNMFRFSQNFNKPIGTWNTSNVTNMTSMFQEAQVFNQNIGTWNTIKVRDMERMFNAALEFNNGGSNSINNWNTGAVNDMQYMFSGAVKFNQPISNWNTGSVGNMNGMFAGASSFNQNLSGWCVTFVFSEPNGFADGATAWTLPKPVWGTCPP